MIIFIYKCLLEYLFVRHFILESRAFVKTGSEWNERRKSSVGKREPTFFCRAESMASSCPGAKPMGTGWCILDNLLEESKLGVAAGAIN